MLPRNMGHRAGVSAIIRTINNCVRLGIPYVTFYAFSTENWKRPQSEIDALFSMFREFLKDNRDDYKKRDIKVISLGDITKFPQDVQDDIYTITKDTEGCKTMCLAFAFNYGARDEIVLAAKKMSEAGDNDYSVDNFKKYLYTAGMPDPDIIIRTSGEMRLSNFLMYQAAYSELYFCKTLWPDFDYRHIVKVIKNYNKRDRRFGSLK